MLEEESEVIEAQGYVRMSGAEGLLLDRERALEERPGRGVVTRGLEEEGEVVQALRYIGVVRPQGLLADLSARSYMGRAAA